MGIIVAEKTGEGGGGGGGKGLPRQRRGVN